MGEANLPTQETQARANPWVSSQDADLWWPGGAQSPAAEGPSSAQRLIWRIRDRKTFRGLVACGRRYRGPVSLAFLPGDEVVPPRVAYAVSRRVGSAVVRNRVRRWFRAAVEGNRSSLQPGGIYLLGATPAIASASFVEVAAAIGYLLSVVERR